MISLPSLARRHCEPEIMDDPDLEAERHFSALRGLARLNSLSLSARLVWRPIAKFARRQAPTGRLRVLDVATGAGDIPLSIWRRAKRSNLNLEIHGADVSPRALCHAQQRAEAAGANITFSQLDVLSQPLPKSFDIIVCSLFLHHLDDEQGRRLLTAMRDATRQLLVVNDLVRNRRGLLMTNLAVRCFTRSDVVRVDGPRSVQAAYSVDEARRLAREAGLEHAGIERCWPCRFVLTWHKALGAQ